MQRLEKMCVGRAEKEKISDLEECSQHFKSDSDCFLSKKQILVVRLSGLLVSLFHIFSPRSHFVPHFLPSFLNLPLFFCFEHLKGITSF